MRTLEAPARASPPVADDLLTELRRQGKSILDDARATLREWTDGEAEELLRLGQERLRDVADEVQFRVDQTVGRALAEHPDLYAELRRGARRLQRTWEKVAQDLGLR